MTDNPKPYPKNAEGDFYVEVGCCMTCMVPEVYAAALMGFDEVGFHCFVAKQPTNDNEVFQLIKAAWAAEFRCIRYGGQNPQIIRRMAEAGISECCDKQNLVQEINPILRNHVTFEYSRIKSELHMAEEFKQYLLNQNEGYLQYKFKKIVQDKSGVCFAFSWYEENYYSVWFNKIQLSNTWHIFHSPDYEKIGSRAVSIQIDDWLRAKENVLDIKWYTNKAWDNFLLEWQKTPI